MNTNSQTCSCANGLIDISGLCNPQNITGVLQNNPYWKQMYLSESLEIPEQKPDIEQINSVVASVSILRKMVIKTPRSYDDSGVTPIEEPNLEGKLLTGRKLVIEGQICQQIEYTANEQSQPVHSVEFYVPFSAYIIVPLEINFTVNGQTTSVDSLDINYDVNACLEDIAACNLDERRILKQVTMLLSAVPISGN